MTLIKIELSEGTQQIWKAGDLRQDQVWILWRRKHIDRRLSTNSIPRWLRKIILHHQQGVMMEPRRVWPSKCLHRRLERVNHRRTKTQSNIPKSTQNSLTEKSNTNLSEPEKELLRWHSRDLVMKKFIDNWTPIISTSLPNEEVIEDEDAAAAAVTLSKLLKSWSLRGSVGITAFSHTRDWLLEDSGHWSDQDREVCERTNEWILSGRAQRKRSYLWKYPIVTRSMNWPWSCMQCPCVRLSYDL